MKKVYIKPDINIISTPELCQEPPIVGGSNASTSDDNDPSLSRDTTLSSTGRTTAMIRGRTTAEVSGMINHTKLKRLLFSYIR